MATTKIWAVKGRIKDLTDYVEDPSKTIGGSLHEVDHILHYTTDFSKTWYGGKKYVTGINCTAEIAAMEMALVKKQYGKDDGIICYHGYQSFKHGEITSDEAHAIGCELAQVMWGDRFQVVVTTHLNTDCIHNHFALNSVSFKDGLKYNSCTAERKKLMRQSDRICSEHNLSVIENPSNNRRSKGAYYAKKAGETTNFDSYMAAIDEAISYSQSPNTFAREMQKQGYEVKMSKYIAIRPLGKENFIRTYRFGEEYTADAIHYKINHNWYPKRHQYISYYSPKRMYFNGDIKKVKKVTGWKALVLHYMYLMGIIPKNSNRQPLTPLMKEEVRHMYKLMAQYKFLCDYNVNCKQDLIKISNAIDVKLNELITARTKIKNKLRRAPESEKDSFRTQQAKLTEQISVLRGDVNIAKEVEQKTEGIRHRIREHRILENMNRIQAQNRNRGWER